MTNIDRTRRRFLKALGAGAAMLALPRATVEALTKQTPRIGVQLYSVRRQLETDFDRTITQVAETGFAGVEYYPLPASITTAHAAQVFKGAGLDVFSMHVELPAGEAREPALRLAEAFNCQRVVYPGWPEGEKYKTRDAIRRTADLYNETAEFLSGKGLQFGLHNHWWELEERDGFVPLYYLLEHLDTKVFFEIDTYWVKVGGADPSKVVGDFGPRAPLLHIKDGPGVKGPEGYKQVPAGEGAMDLPAVIGTGGDNIEWLIVEFDEYEGDIFDGIRKSYGYLSTNGLGKGKI